jgi:uncharacterized membrane protein
MELLDKYVAEIGKHLPRNQRADIEKEIRSTLEDMLEERNQTSVNEEAVIDLLKEYGEPRKVAESYIGPRYLISPRIFPTFELVVKIVLLVLLGVGLFGYAVSASLTDSFSGVTFLSFLAQFWSGMLSGMMNAFGVIVLVFAILDRVLPASEFEKDEDEWDPAELAKESDPDEVKISEAITTIIFTVAGLFLLNLYPDNIGIHFMSAGEWNFIPVLSDAFFSYMPWINLIGGLQIAFSLYQLRQKMWNFYTRLANIVIDVGTIGLAIVMLKGPSLIGLSADELAGTPVVGASDVLTRLLGFVPDLVLFIVIVVSSVEVLQMAFKMFKLNYKMR